MSELKFANLFIGTLVILSCTLLVLTFGYINTMNNYENVTVIAQLDI